MAADDQYSLSKDHVQDPLSHAAAVSPDDDEDLEFVTRALYVGTGGDVRVTLLGMADGTHVTYANVQGGSLMPWRVKRVWESGTMAQDIVGGW